jgi:hypothetical protein
MPSAVIDHSRRSSKMFHDYIVFVSPSFISRANNCFLEL